MMSKVFKVCEEDDWESIKNEDFFLGSKPIEVMALIFYFRTIEETLENISNQKVPCVVGNAKLMIRIVGRQRNDQLFPHLYEPLPLSIY